MLSSATIATLEGIATALGMGAVKLTPAGWLVVIGAPVLDYVLSKTTGKIPDAGAREKILAKVKDATAAINGTNKTIGTMRLAEFDLMLDNMEEAITSDMDKDQLRAFTKVWGQITELFGEYREKALETEGECIRREFSRALYNCTNPSRPAGDNDVKRLLCSMKKALDVMDDSDEMMNFLPA
jgi:hypothetical protein